MTKTRKLTTMAMFIALASMLVLLVRIPLIPAAPFLIYDPADIPILIGAFVFGPVAGIVMTVVLSLIQGLFLSGDGWYGIIMHIAATGTFVLVAGLIYGQKKTLGRAVIGMVVATLVTVLVMVGCNLVITPIFTGWPRSSVAQLLIPGIIPFNLIKFVINGLITFLLYKPISNIVKRPSNEKERKSVKVQ